MSPDDVTALARKACRSTPVTFARDAQLACVVDIVETFLPAIAAALTAARAEAPEEARRVAVAHAGRAHKAVDAAIASLLGERQR